MHDRLDDKARAYVYLRDALAKQYGLDNDDEVLTDTLEGETDLNETLIRAAREAQRRAAMADAIGSIIKDNQARKKRHEGASEAIRDAVAEAMETAGLKKVEAPDMTLTFRALKPSLEVTDEQIAMDSFGKTKRVLDKAAANDAFKRSQERGETFDFPGFSFSNGGAAVTIRTK